MRCGLIARGEDRGLGVLTAAFAEHMQPDRTLLVDMGPLARGFRTFPERFRNVTVAPFRDGRFPETLVREWLDGLDVLYSAETFYDDRLPGWAKEAGVATVLAVMPEFYRPEMEPTVCWAPTSWRLDLLPPDAVIVPVPVESRAPMQEVGKGLHRDAGDAHRDASGPLRVVHVAGHRAAMDRNGTTILATALPRVRLPRNSRGMVVDIWTQDRRLPSIRGGNGVQVRRHIGGTPDRWQMYEGADLMVMPRRYGGLCLPVQEAMACGLGVVMTDCAPNWEWPVCPVVSHQQGQIRTPGGEIDLWNADPQALAAVLVHMVSRPDVVDMYQGAAREWTLEHTWDVWRPLYEQRLAEAVARL